MSTSYGTITITDTTDLGQLSVYLTGSTVRQQIYDGNANATNTYFPNWDTSNSGTALVITPHVYYNGSELLESDTRWRVSWTKVEGEFSGNIPTSTTPEAYVDSNAKAIRRNTNLTPNTNGVTYTATISVFPISGDNTTKITGIATIDFTIANAGINGRQGDAASYMQLIGSSSYFAYDYGSTTGKGITSITLTAKTNISNYRWYCGTHKLTVGDVNNTSSTADYVGASLTIYSASNTPRIETLCTTFTTDDVAVFRIAETNESGVEVSNGFEDYFSIYRAEEARPGDNVYSCYLDNDEETVTEYNGTVDFTNAETTFRLTKNGVNELTANSGWVIAVTSNGVTYNSSKVDNTLPGSTSYNHAQITGMNGNTGWVQFTATKTGVATQTKRFTIVKNPALVSHSLRLDSVISNRSLDSNNVGVYTPNQIVIDAIVRTGGGTSSYRDEGVIQANIHYEGDSADSTTLVTNAANSPLRLTLADKPASDPVKPIDYITVSLMYNSNEVDSQKITISKNGADGSDGTSPWVFGLKNQFDSISTDFGYKISTSPLTIEIPFDAMEGTTVRPIYCGNGSNYPKVSAANFEYNNSNVTSVTPTYYLGSNSTTPVTSGQVDRVKYVITNGNAIKTEGTIAITFSLADGTTVVRNYNYKAQPQALKPITTQLLAVPSNTFSNQTGISIVTPVITSGTENILTSVTKYTWYVYYDGEWKILSNTSTSSAGYICIPGIKTGTGTESNWSDKTNGTSQSTQLKVTGSAVEGFLGFKLVATITFKGVSGDYTEYINFTDINDPLQVELISTLGLQIKNKQGVGVIYARVIRNNEEIDPIVSDDLLAIGTDTPSSSSPNTGIWQGKLGYIKYSTSTPYTIDYYSRATTSATWTKRAGTQATYSWTFRNESNNTIVAGTSGIAPSLNYVIANNVNTQFIYLDGTVVNNKLTANVQVTV